MTQTDLTNGNDTYVALENYETVMAGAGDDHITLAALGIMVEAGAGNDNIDVLIDPESAAFVPADSAALYMGEGDDWVSFTGIGAIILGEAGNDNLSSYGDYSSLDGGEGDDTLTATGASNVVIGGAGNDRISAISADLSGSQHAEGGLGNDDITAMGSQVNVTGDDGDDTIFVVAHGFDISGGAGNDHITVGGPDSFGIVTAGDGDDVINAKVSGVLIDAGAGMDFIAVSGTAVSVYGGSGFNTILAAGTLNEITGGDDGNIVQFVENQEMGRNSGGQIWTGVGTDIISGQIDNANINSGAGIDTITISGDHNFITDEAGHSEITVTGSNNFLMTANESDRLTVKGDFNGVLGQGGDDFISVAGSGNDVSGGDGNDTLATVGGLSVLRGETGNDTLISNADGVSNAQAVLIGGEGDDLYVISQTGTLVMIDETTGEMGDIGGYDVVEYHLDLSFAFETDTIELYRLVSDHGLHFIGSAFGDRVEGSAGIDFISGNGGNDILDGGLGADLMGGGLGDDLYIVNGEADLTIELEGEGTDTVQTDAASFELQDNVENLFGIAGVAGQFLIGNTLANWIKSDAFAATIGAGDGDDRLETTKANATMLGETGDDTLIAMGRAASLDGGLGNDTYVLSFSDAQILENANAGRDTIRTDAFSIDLRGSKWVENATLTGGANLKLTGNGLANVLTGNMGKNAMTGGAGKDVFKLLSASDSAIGTKTRDTISDFVQKTDKMDLSAIDASLLTAGDQAFSFIGAKGFTKKAGQLHVEEISRPGSANDVTIVSGDINGDGKADFEIELQGNMRLHDTDFIL